MGLAVAGRALRSPGAQRLVASRFWGLRPAAWLPRRAVSLARVTGPGRPPQVTRRPIVAGTTSRPQHVRQRAQRRPRRPASTTEEPQPARLCAPQYLPDPTVPRPRRLSALGRLVRQPGRGATARLKGPSGGDATTRPLLGRVKHRVKQRQAPAGWRPRRNWAKVTWQRARPYGLGRRCRRPCGDGPRMPPAPASG